MVVPWSHSAANKVQTLNVFLRFFFVLYVQIIPHSLFLKNLMGLKFRMAFFGGLIFGPGIFLGFVGSLRYFFGS